MHRNSLWVSLPGKQAQADLIMHIKYLTNMTRCKAAQEWVEGHTVERKGWQHCSFPKPLNNQANKLAKQSLLHVILGGAVIKGDFPFKLVKIKVFVTRVSGSPRLALELNWGYSTMLTLFSNKQLVRREDFHLVWWDGLGAAMALYSKMYQVSLTKHVSDFAATMCSSTIGSKDLTLQNGSFV
jgi:hypothetical protein